MAWVLLSFEFCPLTQDLFQDASTSAPEIRFSFISNHVDLTFLWLIGAFVYFTVSTLWNDTL
jgi:hypothetical protein